MKATELAKIKREAAKWNALKKAVYKFYDEENPIEGDLCDIGLITAQHLGYL